MRQSVSNGFIQVTKDHEGIVPWLYLDVKGFVTTGIGNLVENLSNGEPLENLFEQPWRNSSNGLASRAEIRAAYDAVKARQDLAHLGGGNPAFANLTTIRLGPPGTPVNVVTPEIRAFVEHVLTNFEGVMRQGVPNFDALRADAQFALFEHAWAVGPSLGGWPKLRKALTTNPPNYLEAQLEDRQGGVTAAREKMTLDLWQNAIDAEAIGADPDTLFYPGTVDNPGSLPPSSSGSSRLVANVARGSPKAAMRVLAGTAMVVGGGGFLAYKYGFFDRLARLIK